MVPQHQATCVTFRRLFKTRAVVLLFSEPLAASEKEKLCKLMAKKGGEIGAERGKRTPAEVFLFWISVSVKRKFPILGKPSMSFLEDLVPCGFAARLWQGLIWLFVVSSDLGTDADYSYKGLKLPILISPRVPWGEKQFFFATCVYHLELCVKWPCK